MKEDISPREELLRLQRALYRHNKKFIEDSICVKEADFDAYEDDYNRAISQFKEVSSVDEMMQAALNADIVYVGDYHTCHQSQRSFLRILKSVVKKDKSIMIGMELIHKKHQDLLKDFLFKRINEEEFLEKTGFVEHWIFDLWDNFRPIFDFTRYHHLPMYAIDAAGKTATLNERDAATAKLLAEIVRDNPTRKMFVFIGDLHLAPNHLPQIVQENLKKFGLVKNDVVLYQNSDAIYWGLAKKELEDKVEVVKINNKSFCRMHTPPIVYQQSYINWLEHEEGEIDFDDAKHSFLQLVGHICKFLDIRLGKEKDDVEVFTCGDLSFLEKLRKDKSFSEEDIELIKRQIVSSESYFISKKRYVYLANLSLNHAGEEAAHYVKNLCSGSEQPRVLVDAFYANVLHEALGFFGSKIINHKRKCAHEKDYENVVDYFTSMRVPAERQLEYETAHLVLEYRKYEKKGDAIRYSTIFDRGPDLFMSITHALGYMLGDLMYYGLLDEKIKKEEVKELFYDNWHSEGRPFEVYSNLYKKLSKVKIPKRM